VEFAGVIARALAAIFLTAEAIGPSDPAMRTNELHEGVAPIVCVAIAERFAFDLAPQAIFVSLLFLSRFLLLSDLAIEDIFQSAFLFCLAEIAGLCTAVFLFVLCFRLAARMADELRRTDRTEPPL